ncbi:MAG TPA: Coenzyme F420 hydrogenase/dehydrogenase, beta subunit C-terminal domain [Candidatus Acidoferrales bacterium]|nr:Coenzyme F420 hydrogenase/dehydrogenase, beta subunit C-terminal domain [Candidatus Acidoferrales bacterium]
MYYGKATDQSIQKRGECGGIITAMLIAAIEQKLIDGALVIKRGESIYDGAPYFATTREEIIEAAGSLHCAPTLSAKFIKSNLNGARDQRIAVTCKPCDARAIIELSKRNQINLENVYMIGVNCGGTMLPVKARETIRQFFEVDPDDVVKEEIAKGKLIIITKDGQHKELSIDDLEAEGYGRRTNCQRCEYNIPRMADLACGNWGVIGNDAGKATFIEVCTEKGQKILDTATLAGVITLSDAPAEGIALRRKLDGIMVKMARKAKATQFAQFEGEHKFEKLFAQFDKCNGCRACIDVCPICSCVECFTDQEFVVPKNTLPPDPMFLLTRLLHVSPSCVNCGQCEDVCPVEIPLATITHMVQSSVQGTLGYVPGQSMTDAIPLSKIAEVTA